MNGVTSSDTQIYKLGALVNINKFERVVLSLVALFLNMS